MKITRRKVSGGYACNGTWENENGSWVGDTEKFTTHGETRYKVTTFRGTAGYADSIAQAKALMMRDYPSNQR